MQYKNAAIIVASLAAQQVTAGDWTDASAYSCPGNTNNHCSGSQQGGYDWSGLQPGSFSSYGSNSFSGFSCSNSFGKRDLLGKRGFQSKCITGSLDDSPSISCSEDDSFSIDQMQVSSSHDADIDCEYHMPDGSSCHQTHSCSEGGSIFQNTQCGGAKSVTFKPGKNAPPGCSVGVHSVGFHCGHASSTVPPYSPSTSRSLPAASSSAPCYGESCSSSSSVVVVSSSVPSCYGDSCSSSSQGVPGNYGSSSFPAPVSSSSSAPVPGCYGGDCSSSVVITSSSAPAPGCYGGSCSSSVVPVSSSAPAPGCYGSSCSSSAPVPGCYGASCSSSIVPVSSSAPAPGCYGGSCSSSVIPVSSSVPIPGCYGKDCSSSSIATSSPGPGCHGASCGSSSWGVPGHNGSSSVPAAVSSSSQGIPGNYGSSSGPAAVSSSSAPPSHPSPNCPGLLPRCLNTWMYMSGCKDNADANCFCKSEQFIKNVMGCIGAWSDSESDTSAAASYLMGLCAPYVPGNPAIITACPSGVKPGPSQVVYSSSSTKGPITSKPAKSTDCTTITYSHTVVVPASYSSGVSAGLSIPAKSYTSTLVTTVTVPAVHITSETLTVGGTTTCSVGLGSGGYTGSAAAGYTTQAGSSAGAIASASAVPTASTFGTSWAASASSGYSSIVPATGAGAKTGSSLVSLALGAIAALAAS